jgi:hypothetical protein
MELVDFPTPIEAPDSPKWIPARPREVKLTIHPIDAFDQQPTYHQFLQNNFSCIRDGFILRQMKQLNRSPFSCLLSNDDSQYDFTVFDPLNLHLFTILRGVGQQSDESEDDNGSDDQIEKLFRIHVYDNNNKLLMRITTEPGNLYQDQINRVECPPGAWVGCVVRRRQFFKVNFYQTFQASQTQADLTIRISHYNHDADEEDTHCPFVLFKEPPEKRKFEIFDHQQAKVDGQQKLHHEGDVEGSEMRTRVVDAQTFQYEERDVACFINEHMPPRKKALLLSAVLVMRFNRDIV